MPALPYKLACLCDLRDDRGRVLLLRRKKAPNQGLHSPVGGKLDTASGESPARCAQREIQEETGLDIPIERLHLMGLVSETAYEGQTHWLLFFYRVLGPVDLDECEMDEGWLEWHDPADVDSLRLPETDTKIIWPMVRKHDALGDGHQPGFFAVHIDCTGDEMTWQVQQEMMPARSESRPD